MLTKASPRVVMPCALSDPSPFPVSPLSMVAVNLEPAPAAPPVSFHDGYRGARLEPDVYHAVEPYRGFGFRYVNDPQSSGKVRVYVEQHPDLNYRGRDSGSHTTHLWPAGHDGVSHPPYLCIKQEYKPASFERAQELAHKWADLTLVYLATGKNISQQLAGD